MQETYTPGAQKKQDDYTLLPQQLQNSGLKKFSVATAGFASMSHSERNSESQANQDSQTGTIVISTGEDPVMKDNILNQLEVQKELLQNQHCEIRQNSVKYQDAMNLKYSEIRASQIQTKESTIKGTNLNSPFCLYKWNILLFQFAINIDTISVLYKYTHLVESDEPFLWQHINRLVPLGVILIEFFINCIPFIARQFPIFCLVYISQIAVVMVENKKDRFQQSLADGYTILIITCSQIIFYMILVWLSQLKMKLYKKEDMYNQLSKIYQEMYLTAKIKKEQKKFKGRRISLINITDPLGRQQSFTQN